MNHTVTTDKTEKRASESRYQRAWEEAKDWKIDLFGSITVLSQQIKGTL